MYAGMSPQLRQELFPGSFGTLPDHADYTLADLARDLPGLDEAVRSMPNATDIDVVGVHEGRVHLADTPRPRRSVIARHGSELIRAVAEDGRRARDAGTDPFRIKATSFHCTDETGHRLAGQRRGVLHHRVDGGRCLGDEPLAHLRGHRLG